MRDEILLTLIPLFLSFLVVHSFKPVLNIIIYIYKNMNVMFTPSSLQRVRGNADGRSTWRPTYAVRMKRDVLFWTFLLKIGWRNVNCDRPMAVVTFISAWA
jgi:hypothetical protein